MSRVAVVASIEGSLLVKVIKTEKAKPNACMANRNSGIRVAAPVLDYL